VVGEQLIALHNTAQIAMVLARILFMPTDHSLGPGA
jgi:hypothetical protein